MQIDRYIEYVILTLLQIDRKGYYKKVMMDKYFCSLMNIYIHVFANYLKALACIYRADFESNDCKLISTSRHVNKILYRGL